MNPNLFVGFVAFVLVSTALARSDTAKNHHTQNEYEKRIVHGKNTTIEDHKYFVIVRDTDGGLCGGALVALDKVVTAGHCVAGVKAPMFIYPGYTNLSETSGDNVTRYASYDLYVHELYSTKDYVYDLAVLRLTKNVELTDKISIVNLAPNPPPIGAKITLVGHGLTDCSTLVDGHCKTVISDQLQTTDMTVAEIQDPQIAVYMTPNRPCKGDSGGPYTYNGQLVAVESHSEKNNCRGNYNYECSTSGDIMKEFLGRFEIYPATD